ncbi:hypothetical protein [Cerasicoccus fimbriatus]|uniref:hypothetical protein n=1 Tax=Cerasicoccus fimbriatus TaxID=3014554 RepID=UPI0022B589EB|nr:hypothetical protein [Cerasicoccus sp. TK19100]
MTKEEKERRAQVRAAYRIKFDGDKTYTVEELVKFLPIQSLDFYSVEQPILASEKQMSEIYCIDQSDLSKMIRDMRKGILGDKPTSRRINRHRLELDLSRIGVLRTAKVTTVGLVADLPCAIPVQEIIATGISPGVLRTDGTPRISVHRDLDLTKIKVFRIVLSHPFDGDLTQIIEVDPLPRKSPIVKAKSHKSQSIKSRIAKHVDEGLKENEPAANKPVKSLPLNPKHESSTWQALMTNGHVVDQDNLEEILRNPDIIDFSEIKKGLFAAELFLARGYSKIKDVVPVLTRFPGFKGGYASVRYWVNYGCIVIFLTANGETPPESHSAVRPIEGLEPDEILEIHRKATLEIGDGAAITEETYKRIKSRVIDSKVDDSDSVNLESKCANRTKNAIIRNFEREPDYSLEGLWEILEEYPEIRLNVYKYILEIDPELAQDNQGA